MESMGQHFLMISCSMGKHGKHGTPHFEDLKEHGKAWEAWDSIFS